MTRFLIRRLLWAVWLFFVATLIVYVIFFLLPSDPFNLGQISGGGAEAPFFKHLRSELHLDVPAYQQYWIFLWNMIRHQSLGYSFQNGASVRWIIAQDAPVTGSVVLGGVFLWLLISIPIGILSALRPRSLFDRMAMVFVLFGIAAPPVWLGLILAYIFGFKLGWFPIADYCSFSSHSGCSGPAHWAYHLILPWVTFMFLYAALYVRLTRASILEVANEDFVRTAWAKGAPRRRVVIRHILRNSMLPVLTMLGMDIALALGTTIYIEEVFNLNGLGVELLGAVHSSNIPVVVGIVICITLVAIVMNFLVDVAYTWLDPRIRLST